MSLTATLSARRKWALGATGVLILVFVALWIIAGGQRSTTASGTPTVGGARATGMAAQPPSGPGSLTLEQQRDLEQSINRIRAVAAVEEDAFALLRTAMPGPSVVLGAIVVLAIDAWRVRAALAAAEAGGGSEVLDAVA